MITERKAAKLANDIYAKHKAGELTDKKASEMLGILDMYLSQTQFIKLLDWQRFVRDNPNFYHKA